MSWNRPSYSSSFHQLHQTTSSSQLPPGCRPVPLGRVHRGQWRCKTRCLVHVVNPADKTSFGVVYSGWISEHSREMRCMQLYFQSPLRVFPVTGSPGSSWRGWICRITTSMSSCLPFPEMVKIFSGAMGHQCSAIAAQPTFSQPQWCPLAASKLDLGFMVTKNPDPGRERRVLVKGGCGVLLNCGEEVPDVSVDKICSGFARIFLRKKMQDKTEVFAVQETRPIWLCDFSRRQCPLLVFAYVY